MEGNWWKSKQTKERVYCPPLPILLANVQSLMTSGPVFITRETKISVTDTWLFPAVPGHAILPADTFSVFYLGRSEGSGKSKGDLEELYDQ